tara:strand:+ start:2072 stop:2698 length:627 start_codon:yes stop_codon:yes gene_type:complete
VGLFLNHDMKYLIRPLFLFVILFFQSQLALAHGFGGSGFLDGLVHPVLGWDHLLAMVAVGILSVQIGGRAVWSVPALFVLMVILSMTIGLSKYELPFLELGIVFSVVFLGITIALNTAKRELVAMVFVAFFAFFHGYAHGVEMPELAKPLLFGVGMAMGTTLLHVFGVAIGVVAERFQEQGRGFLRHVGSGLAGIGLFVLATEYLKIF